MNFGTTGQDTLVPLHRTADGTLSIRDPEEDDDDNDDDDERRQKHAADSSHITKTALRIQRRNLYKQLFEKVLHHHHHRHHVEFDMNTMSSCRSRKSCRSVTLDRSEIALSGRTEKGNALNSGSRVTSSGSTRLILLQKKVPPPPPSVDVTSRRAVQVPFLTRRWRISCRNVSRSTFCPVWLSLVALKRTSSCAGPALRRRTRPQPPIPPSGVKPTLTTNTINPLNPHPCVYSQFVLCD